MTTTPYARTMMQIDGAAAVFGPQEVAGGNVIQLLGESTVEWRNQTWQLYEYPLGYPLPAGWSNNNGIYENTLVVPPTFTISSAFTRWGKYLTRLVVNQGLLAGVYAGPGSIQPLVDNTGVLETKSPLLGLTDIGFQETNQFDAIRQWMGELKKTLRRIEEVVGGFATLTTDATVTRILRVPVTDGHVRAIRGIITVHSTDNSGAVRGEWEVKGSYGRVAGTLAAEVAATVTPIYVVGAPGGPTFTLNGNTDVDLNVTGIAATGLTWKFSEFVL